MKKYPVLVFAALLLTLITNAQKETDKKYNDRAKEVQDEVWGSPSEPFKQTEIPAEYKNESAVILAKSFEVTNSAHKRLKMGFMIAGVATRFKYFTTYRERVKINDKTALEEYSTLEYKKKLSKTFSAMLVKIYDSYKTFVGAKIIKPGSPEVIVNTSEEVLTKDESKDKEGKLAIPNLQVGDILEYYIRTEELTETGADIRGPDVFFLGGLHPILYYNVKYILDDKCGAHVLCANGATPFVQSRNDDKDLVLEFTEKNLPRLSDELWTSLPRQLPYRLVRYTFATSSSEYDAGKVKQGPYTDEYKNRLKDYMINAIKTEEYKFTDFSNSVKIFDGIDDVEGRPVDSIVNYIYNYCRWSFYSVMHGDKFNVTTKYNEGSFRDLTAAIACSEKLRDYDIPNDIVLVSSRYSNSLGNIFSPGDFEYFVRVNGNGKLKWLGFNDFFELAGQLPAMYQGENALILTREGKDRKPKFADSETPIKLPVANNSENISNETLNVDFTSANPQVINIERTCKLTGAMKQNDQKKLLLPEDVNAGFAAAVKKDRAVNILADSKKTRSSSQELQSAFEKERPKQKDYFKDDVKEQYDQDPKEMVKYEVLNNGFNLSKPAFEYKEVFTMDNFVKKAGPNYLFEVGRLMGTYKKLDGKDRDRKVDVFMPCARQLNYTFNITMPAGYTVKGMETLNKTFSNDVASFTSTAKLAGNLLTVTVSRIYNNNFEKAANWSKLLQVMDAASDFTGTKILLEKQ